LLEFLQPQPRPPRRIANLREAIKALGMAEFRGFTFLEKTGQNGQPVKNPAELRSLQPIEQWFWLKGTDSA
jgi:hypothetical protein